MEFKWSTVLLVVLGIVLVYVVYRLLTTGRLSKLDAVDLKTQVPPVTAIISPGSNVYTYSMWVYVNTWSRGTKTIFCAGPSTQPDCALTLDSTSPTLICTFKGDGTSTQPITITDNFPVSKWVYVTVAVNVTVVDCYLNGKLVKSHQLTTLPPMPTFTEITFGRFDCNLVGFTRVPIYEDAGSIEAKYLRGNGYSASASLVIPKYGLKVGVTKDGVSDSNFTLF